MTQTPATAQVDPESAAPIPTPRGPIRAGYPVLVLALLWPVQLIFAGPVIAGVAQAQIAEHFHTAQIVWLGLVPTLAAMLLTPLAVKFGEVFGKRRIMLWCLGIAMLGNLFTALAPTYSWMLIGRGIGAFYLPLYGLVFATVREIFPPRRAASATGIIGGATGAVLLFTPQLASWMLDAFQFRSLLWLLAGFTVLGYLLTLAFVPETARRATLAGFDWTGAVLLGGSATILVYALGKGIDWGWSSPEFLLAIALGLVLAAVFVLVERAAAQPLLDVRMLARREVATVLASTSLALGATFTLNGLVGVLLAFYPRIPHVSDGFGWSAEHYALIVLPGGVLMLIAGFATGAMVRRISPRITWQIGNALLILGIVWTAFHHHDATDIIVSWLIVGVGTGMSLAASPVLVLSAVSKQEQGMIGGMQLMLMNLATALGGQLAYILLDRHAVLFHGTAFYLDAGYRGAYLGLGAMMVAGLLITFAMTRLRKPSTEDESPSAV